MTLRKRFARPALAPAESTQEPAPRVFAHQHLPSMDVVVRDVFVRAGGRAAFAAWARQNPHEFYTKVLPKVLPTQITGRDGGDFRVIVEQPTPFAEPVPGVLNSPVTQAIGGVADVPDVED